MLLELKVSNFAIIENLQIEFGKGLNILSGETGAGKSVLLKSLALLMGVKGSS
jgi:DNA repair protein RecN (Recombination protein N)